MVYKKTEKMHLYKLANYEHYHLRLKLIILQAQILTVRQKKKQM